MKGLLYRLGITLLAAWLVVPQCAFSQQSSQPGRGVPNSSRQGIVNPMQSPYNATCNGVDDTAALNSLLGQGGRVVTIPAGARCSVDHLVIPANTTLQGTFVGTSVLTITGTGGGRCGPGTNGGIQLLAGGVGRETIDNLTILAVNPALDCLINVSATGSDVPHVALTNLRLRTSSGLQPTITNPIGLYTNNVASLRLDTVDIWGKFRQQWLSLGDLNGVSATALTLHPNSSNLPGGVYNDSNPMASFAGHSQDVNLAGLICEQGPTCLTIGPSSSGVQISGAWAGDPAYHCSPWLPQHSYPAGACVFPSIPATASTYAGNYTGHVYVTPRSGVSGGSAPGFPTGHNATMADGSVTWIEYGSGGMFELDAPGTSVSGNTIAGAAGVSVYAGASAQGLSISGNQFYAPSVAAVYVEGASGLLIGGNHLYLGTAVLKLKNAQVLSSAQ
jgi:hypothetical protein